METLAGRQGQAGVARGTKVGRGGVEAGRGEMEVGRGGMGSGMRFRVERAMHNLRQQLHKRHRSQGTNSKGTTM